MASKRQEQIAELLKRNFGIVLRDKGSYIYGNAFVTVTSAAVTPDLSLAKLYISVYNTENKEEVLERIRRHIGPLKGDLGHRIKRHVRRVPNLSIFLDDTLDEMYKLNKIFDDLGGEEE